MHAHTKPSKQKLLSTFIASIFCSTAVYAAAYTDTVKIPTQGSVTLIPGDTVSTNNQNGIEILETGTPSIGKPSGILTTDGAVISVTGTDSDTAGIYINASGRAVIHAVNTKITNESGWGIVIDNLNNNSASLNFSGSDTLIEGGAGAIKFAPGVGSNVVKLSNEAKLNGDVQITDDPASSINNLKTIHLEDKVLWTGDMNSDAQAMVVLKGESTWNGDANISSTNPDKKGVFNVQLNGSTKSGLTQFNTASSVNSDVLLQAASSWLGDVKINDNGANSIYSFGVADNSSWKGDLSTRLRAPSVTSPAAANATIIRLSLSNGAQWDGNISLISDDNANYGHLNMSIQNSKLFNSTITVAGKNTFSGLVMNSFWNGEGNFNLVSDASKQNEFTFSLLSGSRAGKTDISAENGKTTVALLGASTWNGDINITGTNQNEGDKNIYLLANSILNGAVNANTTHMAIVGSKWNLSGNSALENIDMQTGAEINFAANTKTRAGGFHTLNVHDLKSDGSGSMFMRTDIAALTGDRLNITNSVLGTVNIHVNNQGGAYVDPTKELTIIESNGYQDHFYLANEVEVGGYKYNMRADGTKLNLFTTYQPTSSAEASINTMDAGYLLRYAENQTLLQRMGDLRQDERVANDVWARAYSGEFNVADGSFLSGYDLDYNGVQIGADRQFNFASGKAYIGAMAGFTKGKQKHHQGSGTIESSSLGIYGTYVHNSGIYVDSLVRYVHMNHDYNVRDSAGARINGSGSTDGYAASLAVGKRFYLEQPKASWYLEPEAQISTSYQNGTSMMSSNGLKTDIDGFQSTQAQVGLRFGHEINLTNNPFNLYVKAAYVRELDGKVAFKLNNLGEKEQFGDNWWTFGAGVTTTFNKQHNVYFDLERSDGASFKHPWQVNLGYRFSF